MDNITLQQVIEGEFKIRLPLLQALSRFVVPVLSDWTKFSIRRRYELNNEDIQYVYLAQYLKYKEGAEAVMSVDYVPSSSEIRIGLRDFERILDKSQIQYLHKSFKSYYDSLYLNVSKIYINDLRLPIEAINFENNSISIVTRSNYPSSNLESQGGELDIYINGRRYFYQNYCVKSDSLMITI